MTGRGKGVVVRAGGYLKAGFLNDNSLKAHIQEIYSF